MPSTSVKIHARPKRSGGEKRGNSYDRRARKAMLVKRHGNGITCACAYCGTPLTTDEIQADRITEGGPYARWNVIPACEPCNGPNGRWDTPFAEWIKRCADPMRAIEAAMIARLARNGR